MSRKVTSVAELPLQLVMKNNINLIQSLLFILLVIGLSFLIFWGPIALFKVRKANLVEGKIYNIPALLLFIIGGFVPSLVYAYLAAILLHWI
jgi:hypothetical protein